jgi:dTDP-4-dehydrorhamnose reductase
LSKIVIVGAGGQVGEKLCARALKKGHIVYGTYKSRPSQVPISSQSFLDKTNAIEVDRLISNIRPNVVVDTGALHNVDYCETHPEEAYAVNRDGTKYLANASKKTGAKFIFVSTDFVFDGTQAPYSESDAPNPESVYAKSKLQGEQEALEANENTCVCRPSVIYSWVSPSAQAQSASSSSGKPLNFAAWFVSQVRSGKDVNIVTDQIASPTLADDLAGAILALTDNESAQGVFHTAGATALSRFDFTVRIAKKLGLNETLIHPTDSSKFKQSAKRPLNSSLISNRIKKEVGYEMMSIEKALDEFAKQGQLTVTTA